MDPTGLVPFYTKKDGKMKCKYVGKSSQRKE